jgi:hypothetical protein
MPVQYFKAPGSGKLVAFNSSDTDCVLLEEISIEEMRGAIAEFERKRIEAYWEETMLPQSPHGPYISAFLPEKTATFTGPVYYKSSHLQKLLDTNQRGAALLGKAHALSIDVQRDLVLEHRPTSRAKLQEVLRSAAPVIAPDFYAMLDEAGSADEFIQRLAQPLWKNELPTMHPFRYFELLTILWARGWFLFPQRVAEWETRIKWMTLTNPLYGAARSLLIRAIHVPPPKGKSDTGYTHTCTFFATADVRTSKDLSPDLIGAFEEICVAKVGERYPPDTAEKKFRSMRGRVRSVALWLLQNFNVENPHHAVELKRPKRNDVADEDRRSDGQFRWLATMRPELGTWADMFRSFIKSQDTARLRSQIDRLNTFGNFLCSLSSPPLEPSSVVRHTHIYDATLKNSDTYLEYLRENMESAKRRNDNLSTVRKFFDWLRDYLIASGNEIGSSFANPVLASDSVGRPDPPSKTDRDALPPYVMNEMKEILVENDFAFPRTYSSATVQVHDYQTGLNTRVFDPGLATCLYTLFDMPIRSHQARWLDSGHLDEKIYDPRLNALVPNDSEFAIKGRREGALRLEHDGLRAESWLTLWVNTNKTAVYDSPHIGYVIPYVSPTLSELLRTYSQWQQRYLPALRKPLAYQVFQEDVKERERPHGVKGPQIAPLFRDPNAADQSRPIEYNRLARFYTKVLSEAQARIERKYGHRLKLVTKDDKGGLKWAVDLHSLRVSGITNLIEAGVPLEVVQQFVAGHATLVMTLHYLKYSPAKLRKFIELAHDRMLNDADFLGSEMFAEYLDEFAPFLLGQNGAGTGAGFRALQEKSGIMTITSEGICPGTSCSTGGALENRAQKKYGPVPGGQRCGLCRYWLTGPAHLLGQVAAVNNLAYAIRKKGLEIASLNDQRIDAEDEKNQRKARELRDRVDILNRELEIDVNEWAARYRYAEKSIALMEQYLSAKQKIIGTGATVPVPILTSSSAPELKVTLEQAHEFALLDQITQMSDFTTGFKNREAELEKNTILSRMMAENGIKPFLLSLNDEQAHEAGNLLSAMVLQQVRGQELDEVLTGKRSLDAYPRLANAIKLLEESSTPEALAQAGEMSRLASLMGDAPAAATPEEDEEMFG